MRAHGHPRWVVGLLSVLAGCASDAAPKPPIGSSGGSAGVGGGSAGATGPQSCDEVVTPKRLVRLTFNQIASSLQAAFGADFAAEVRATSQIAPTSLRAFPPLGDTSEGDTYIAARWQSAEAIAAKAGEYVLANFAQVTGCAEPATAECGQAFLLAHAEQAYRRPLTDREKTSVLQVYADVSAGGGTVQQSVQAGVRGIYGSPKFLYRTEFGTSASAGLLAPHEQASQLSYFLTDGPPDTELRAAAAASQLSTDAEITTQVDRLLSLPQTRANLTDLVFSAFGIARVRAVAIDDLPADVFNGVVAASMAREGELFINDVLWNGGLVNDLVTSRKTFVDARLAPLYGLAAPAVGLDAQGFGPVELPGNRSGVLTSLGFLTSRSRPDQPSVVGRGLSISDSILCQVNPPFPEALGPQIASVNMMLHDLTEREQAAYRATTAPCLGCHKAFDPYGLALENFDVIGRFRTTDPQGRPIDPSVTLPEVAGNRAAANAVEMGKALAETDAFTKCVGTKLVTYALTETGVDSGSCATQMVAERFAQSDGSFAALVRAVAISKTLTQRTGG
jgi:hypothetical protein